MYAIDQELKASRTVRRPFPGAAVGLGFVLLLALAVMAAAHTVFPLFPLMLFFFASRRLGRVTAWRGGPPAIGTPMDGPPAPLPGGISKEKELLEALERQGEITAARVALETSLSVAEAEEMLSGLANNGHVRVGANGGKLAYALWD